MAKVREFIAAMIFLGKNRDLRRKKSVWGWKKFYPFLWEQFWFFYMFFFIRAEEHKQEKEWINRVEWFFYIIYGYSNKLPCTMYTILALRWRIQQNQPLHWKIICLKKSTKNESWKWILICVRCKWESVNWIFFRIIFGFLKSTTINHQVVTQSVYEYTDTSEYIEIMIQYGKLQRNTNFEIQSLLPGM